MSTSTQATLTGLHFGERPAAVLVTGGTGFIGQRLVRALRRDGHSVTLLTRNPSKAAKLFDDDQISCISSMQALPASKVIDVIINLAGARIIGLPWTESRKQTLRDSRIGLTHTLIEWIARADTKPALLLSASAIGYYGIQQQGDDSWLTETSPTQSIFMASLCHDWEAEAHRAADYGVSVACMRFGMVWGDGGALPMMLLPIKLGLGGRLGSGRQWLSWIHIDDLLRAIAHLWQQHYQPQSKTQNQPQAAGIHSYNFTAPEALTQFAFSKLAAQLLHRPCFMPTPAWPMRLLLGEQADILLEGQRVMPAQLQHTGFHFQYPSAEAALRQLCQ